jgi:UDP-N-acetylmuramoylalanine--D-glutamate ligase
MGKAVVVGLARSGLGAANLLSAMGNEVTVTDIRAEAELQDWVRRLSPLVNVRAGGHPPGIFRDAELVVLSPGVPLDAEPIALARESGAEVIGELELAFRVMKDIPFYAVTGTNGKSTTVSLLDLMLKNSGRRSLLGGNIGNALTEEISKRANGKLDLEGIDCVVAEVSSFQLDTAVSFRPNIAAVLNITADHLDRYGSMEKYRESKGRICGKQGAGDSLVLNADDVETMALRPEPAISGGPETLHFSRTRQVKGVCLKGDELYCDLDPSGPIIGVDEIRIRGLHNIENAMAASLMALLAGCPAEAVASALREFPGLEHRLEFVREIYGVRFVNDSKGTNVGAAVKSIESFDSPVLLIAGGRDKDGDFDALARAAAGRVRAVLLIGEAREKLMHALGGVVACSFARDLDEAVTRAMSMASPGDVVLLSPACASFDMFSDFEERGRVFKEVVRGL